MTYVVRKLTSSLLPSLHGTFYAVVATGGLHGLPDRMVDLVSTRDLGKKRPAALARAFERSAQSMTGVTQEPEDTSFLYNGQLRVGVPATEGAFQKAFDFWVSNKTRADEWLDLTGRKRFEQLRPDEVQVLFNSLKLQPAVSEAPEAEPVVVDVPVEDYDFA